VNNITNQVAFLPTTREFPSDGEHLSVEVSRSYINVANAVNARTIGIFTTNRPAANGEYWFLFQNKRQQGFRQAYNIPAISAYPHLIPHGINITRIGGFVRIWGTFTDGTIWYTLPYVDILSATNQIKITVDATNIIIDAGAGTPPTISSGTIVLEWTALP